MATRQGVCSGLKEVLENVSRTQLAEYLGTLLPLVQSALLDTDPGVRQVYIWSACLTGVLKRSEHYVLPDFFSVCCKPAEYLGALLPLMQSALLDGDPGVRQVRLCFAWRQKTDPLSDKYQTC